MRCRPRPSPGPPTARSGLPARPLLRRRCGYCDFNTYTATELGGGASQAAYAQTATAEVRFAARVLGDAVRPAETVFFGGGTPTLLPADDLATMLAAVRDEFGLAPGAEVTTEANPDSVTPEGLATLREAGFTRVSFGMQSAVPHVLAVLERTHDPARVPLAVRWAREAGLDVSLDLIYGTPGESVDDLRRSLDAALACSPDHVSAYALIVEQGTKLAAQMRRGEVPEPSDDDEADKYEVVDDTLAAAGYGWYEVSNWARGPEFACRHNLAYWRGGDWWGIGPGAHSHVGGCGGGTSSTPAPTRDGWTRGRHPPTPANASPRTTAASRTCSCAPGSPRVSTPRGGGSGHQPRSCCSTGSSNPPPVVGWP